MVTLKPVISSVTLSSTCSHITFFLDLQYKPVSGHFVHVLDPFLLSVGLHSLFDSPSLYLHLTVYPIYPNTAKNFRCLKKSLRFGCVCSSASPWNVIFIPRYLDLHFYLIFDHHFPFGIERVIWLIFEDHIHFQQIALHRLPSKLFNPLRRPFYTLFPTFLISLFRSWSY